VEIGVFEKKSFQDASWVDLGSIWVAEGVVLGGLGGVKLGVRRSQGLVLGGLKALSSEP